MSFLLDTNVISEIGKPRPHPHVVDWIAGSDPDTHFLSVITIGELRAGIILLRRKQDHDQADRIEAWMNATERSFGERILPIDRRVAVRWGDMATGRTVQIPDALIAATAHVHHLTVVTRDIRGFTGTGVPLMNPFEPA
jgi:predicted nucleic acid-binding protein